MNTSSTQGTVQDTAQKKPAEPQQLNRACEACRLLKVRCLPDSTSTSTICQRCKKSGRICVYAAPQKRRQRIRTDTRVAELEREIRAMRSLLTGGDELATQNRRGKESTPAASQDSGSIIEADRSTTASCNEERSSIDEKDRSRQSSVPTSQSATPGDDLDYVSPHRAGADNGPPKEFGLLSPGMSNQLFESFNNDLVPHFPVVVFPKKSTPDIVRKSTPILFQAAVTAAACQLESVLFDELFTEMNKVYAEVVFLNGEKSLELVQSLLLTSIWHCPPDESCGPQKMRFYQYIHMAATMALDLGIGLVVDKSTITVDECRTLLSCYLNCAGIAMRMRRPNMLQWTNEMGDCLDVLENSPGASILDKRLAAWVKLQNIADEWSKSIGLINSQVELSLKGFNRQLQKWKELAEPGVINGPLALAYHQNSIYLYESALEGGSTILVDFNHRFFEPPSGVPANDKQEATQPPLSAAYINAVMACIESSHALLDEFLATEIHTLRVVPIVYYVRASYAIVVLVKLHLSASVPSNELGKVLDCQLLKVDFYMEALQKRISEAVGPMRLRVPSKWLRVVQQVNDWYHKNITALGRGTKQHQKEPEAHEVANHSRGATEDKRPGLRDPSGLYFCPPSKATSFPTAASLPTTASIQEQSSIDMGSTVEIPEGLQNPGTPPENPTWSNDPNTLNSTCDHPISNYASFEDDTSSITMADFAPMDFQDDGLSFLNLPSGPTGALTSWMPDDGILATMDLNYDAAGPNSWPFRFT